MHKTNLYRKKRKHLTLIEVLIAFSIVVMSIFPLLYPHVFIFRQQSIYTQKIEMNHAVNLMFGEIYRRLYQQEIPLNDILGEREFLIDEGFLKAVGFDTKPGFSGHYYFNLVKRKTDEDKTKAAYLVDLIFNLQLRGEDKEKRYHFTYSLFVYQESAQSSTEVESDENDTQTS